ncbi:MAG: PorT family protein [Fibrobacter sp.]|nr:PorT family protein [Fibrobacter sp.]
MNLKITGIVSVLALAAMTFAAPDAAPAQPAPAATAAPEAAAPEAATPATEATAPAAAEPAAEAAPEQAAADAAVAAPAEEAPAEEAGAPMAVRGGEAPAPSQSAPAAEPAPAASANATAPAPSQTVVYRTVYSPEPVELSGTQVRTVYVTQASSPESESFDDLRGLIPMKWSLGVQGFIGSYHMYSSYSDDYNLHDYDGLTWRAGLAGIIPVTQYTIGVKVAALFEQSEAKASAHTPKYTLKGKFKQRKVDVPVLFAFKAPRSSLMFEIGTQASIAIKDEFRATIDGKTSKLDMIDKDYRNTIDWDIVCGFSIMANRYLGFDFRFNIGISNLYDTDNSDAMKLFEVDDLSSTSFLLGASFYIF